MKRKAYILFLLLAGCGRYLPPLPPELLAPSAVRTLEVTADLQGVNFKWDAPDRDQMGTELKTIEGYRVYRKVLEKPSDLINEDIEYDLLAMIEDKHLVELDKLREEAIEQNRPSRKVKVDEALTKFAYTDNQPVGGKLYAYQIVPINQDGVEGMADKIIKVLYRGTTSEIVMIDQAQIEEDIIE